MSSLEDLRCFASCAGDEASGRGSAGYKGPEIRLKEFASGKVELKNGQTFTLTTEDIVGDESRVAITYKELPDDVKPGDTILIDDGLIGLEVKKIQKVSGAKADAEAKCRWILSVPL